MTTTPTYRHDIDFGESLRWEPPVGTAEFFVWQKRTADGSAMRWRRVGGFNLLTDRPITIPEASGQIEVPMGRLDMAWGDLLMVYDGFDSEIMQVTAHDAGARLITVDIYSLPPPTSTDPAVVAAQERRVLADLLKMRLGLSAMHGGHVSVKTPDGTEVERMPIAVVDKRIAEVRARIAWFEQAAEGNTLPRAEYW